MIDAGLHMQLEATSEQFKSLIDALRFSSLEIPKIVLGYPFLI